MGNRRARLRGPAAASALAVASLMAPAAADAQFEVCEVECVEPIGNTPTQNAFSKLSQLGFPGNTQEVFFQKVAGAHAFNKLSQLGFPGGTENVFLKIK